MFHELDKSLESRLQYNGTIAIPMSAGIDSGIIAFFADKLGPIKALLIAQIFIYSNAMKMNMKML